LETEPPGSKKQPCRTGTKSPHCKNFKNVSVFLGICRFRDMGLIGAVASWLLLLPSSMADLKICPGLGKPGPGFLHPGTAQVMTV